MNTTNNDILQKLNEVSNSSGRKDKEALLKVFLQEEEFKEYIIAVLDPNTTFYITEIPSERPDVIHGHEASLQSLYPVNDIFDALVLCYKFLESRELSGYDARAFLYDINERLDDAGKNLLNRIITRKLKIGAEAKTINKAAGETLIYIPPYMRCSSFNKKNLERLSFPVISQCKMDGQFINISVTSPSKGKESVVTAIARQGKDSTYMLSDAVKSFFANAVKQLPEESSSGWVFMGEALVRKENSKELMPRELGNGYLNGNDVDPDRVVFYLWDVVTIDEFAKEKSITPYAERFKRTTDVIDPSFDVINLVESVSCETVDDVIEHFKEMRIRQEEGTVIKAPAGIWKSGESKDQIKIKVIFDCDLNIIGFSLGETGGQFEESLGNILMESSDGMCKVYVGGGLSIEEREYIWNHQHEYLNTIATVKANDLTVTSRDENGEPTVYSLFLPRVDKFRPDKTEADSLERIKEQVQSFIDALKLLEK